MYLLLCSSSPNYSLKQPNIASLYSVGEGALKYTSLPIHTANLTGLTPSTSYHYRVGDGSTWSPDFTFVSSPDYRKAAPAEVLTASPTHFDCTPTNQFVDDNLMLLGGLVVDGQVSWAVFGDMGTTAPMGAEVTKGITKDHAAKPFNIALHVGDLCYAGVNKDGEWEPTWVSNYH
jgi:hypothetical protein